MRARWSDGVVTLRPLIPGDVDRFYEAARESVATVGAWLTWCHADYSRREAAEWIASRPEAWERGEAYSFGVFDASDGRLLGGCGLNSLNPLHRFANLGYWIRSSSTSRGAATSAARLAARFGFVELGLVRIEIVVSVGNIASRRVAEKVGASYEGLLRRRLVTGERVDDAWMFSLIPEDLTPA